MDDISPQESRYREGKVATRPICQEDGEVQRVDSKQGIKERVGGD